MFSEKINTLMALTGASAADLAALAGFDRSNISRLRSGKRVPLPDSSTVAKLIEGIYLFSDSRNDLKTLCSLTGANENDPADTIRQSIRRQCLLQDYRLATCRDQVSYDSHTDRGRRAVHVLGRGSKLAHFRSGFPVRNI